MRRSISRIIAERGARDPSEPVVLDARGVLTAGELAAGARSLARRLRRAGVRVDDHVEVSLGNDRDMVIACCAVWEAGATPLPLAPGLVHAERERIEDIARPTASIGALPARPDVVHLQVAGTADGADDTDRSPDLDPDLAASCWKAMTTSGSTGRPKIVRASAPALLDPDLLLTRLGRLLMNLDGLSVTVDGALTLALDTDDGVLGVVLSLAEPWLLGGTDVTVTLEDEAGWITGQTLVVDGGVTLGGGL